MNGIVETRKRTFVAAETLTQYHRVKLSSGELTEAGLADNDIGTVDVTVLAADDLAAVNLRTLQGTELVVAAGAISVGDKVYTAADGKVSATDASTSYRRGTALEAATADGDIIEILPVWTNTAET